MKRLQAVYLGWAGSPISGEVEELVREKYEVVYAHSCTFGERLDQNQIAPDGADYLFSFGPQIVRRGLLDRIRRAAVNFHTGPPRWPGRGSISFALLNGDTDFGVTAHLMTEEIDRGAILQVLRFPIGSDDDVASIDARSKAAIPELAAMVLDSLSLNQGKPMPSGERWERRALTQAELRSRMRIDELDDDDTVARKIRAFSHPTKPGPYVERGGRTFWYLGGSGT